MEEFNQVSAELQKKFPLPKLKKGEVVVYELANLEPDNMDPEKDERKKRLKIPFQFGSGNQDRVLWGEGDLAEWVDIAFIKSKGIGGSVTFGDIVFHSKDAGTIILVGGRKTDDLQYTFMEMCNWNGSNPYRDKSYPIHFKRKDVKKEAQEKRLKRNLMADAIKTSQELKLAMLRKIAIGVFGSAGSDEDDLRLRIESYAEENPEAFLAMVENTDLNIMEVADSAVKKGLISFDTQKRKIMSEGNTIFSWPPEANVKPYEKFVEYVKSDEGVAFYNELKERLKDKK